MGVYLERYKSGEHKAVWSELTALGEGILKPEIYDAVDVARATMKRVRHNVELLYERLIELKYEFELPKEYAFNRAVPEERRKHLPYIEKTFGKLPLSLRMWYEEVGDVVFTGNHPYLAQYSNTGLESSCCDYTDPLFCFVWEFDPKYLYTFTQLDATGFISFSPDDLHKANVSGGAALELQLSGNVMDSLVYNLPDKNTKIYFIDYLRWVFHWGGFPGFEQHLTKHINANYGWHPQWKFPLIELSYLTDGLLEF